MYKNIVLTKIMIEKNLYIFGPEASKISNENFQAKEFFMVILI